MKAHEFVAQKGIEEVKRVLSGAPEHCVAFDMKEEKHIEYENTSIAMAFLRNRFMCMGELKQVVESVGLIDSYGGITKAKSLCNCFSNACKSAGVKASPRFLDLQKAIADYELVEIYKGDKND